MDITGMDITILIASTVGIILMSFAFPALGMSGETTEASEVPEFNIEDSRFNFAGDFPQRPGSPDSGVLRQKIGGEDEIYDDMADLWRDNGHFIELQQNGYGPGLADDQLSVELQYVDSDGVIQESEIVNYTQSEEGDVKSLGGEEFFGMEVDVKSDWDTDQSNVSNAENVTWEIEWDIQQEMESTPTSDSDSSWVSRIPVVGGALSSAASTAGDVASVASWIGSVLYWFFLTMWEVVLNMVGVAFDIVVFMFGLASFLVDTYSSITSAEVLDSWAQVILLVPGILFMIEWAKIAVVMVEVIWIG